MIERVVATAQASPPSFQTMTPTAEPDGGGGLFPRIGRLPLVLDGAARIYVASGTRLIGTSLFAFWVWHTTNEADAQSVTSDVERLVLADSLFGTLRPASAPAIRDETRAFGGQIQDSDGTEFDDAVLVIREGRFVHVWAGAGLVADPLPELVEIAGRVWAGSDPPDNAPLLDRLPDLGDLPRGFILDDEEPGRAT